MLLQLAQLLAHVIKQPMQICRLYVIRTPLRFLQTHQDASPPLFWW